MRLIELQDEADCRRVTRQLLLAMAELYPELKWSKHDVDETTGEIFDNGYHATWTFPVDHAREIMYIHSNQRYLTRKGDEDDFSVQLNIHKEYFEWFLNKLGQPGKAVGPKANLNAEFNKIDKKLQEIGKRLGKKIKLRHSADYNTVLII